MGRSGAGGGRSGGGGHSGGGRSGGSRSSGRSAMGGSGGRSGMGSSSRPGGGFGGSSRPSGGFGGPRPNPRPNGGFGGPRPGGVGPGPMPGGGFGGPRPPRHSNRPPRRGGGCSSVIGVVFAWLLVVYLLFSCVGNGFRYQSGNAGYTVDYNSGSSSGVTKSTVKRDKLKLNLSDEAGYFTDECGWIQNRTTLEKGLKSFYDETGILPYVYIIDNVAGDYDPSTQKLEQFAETQYEQLFDDEGHILLVFWDYNGAYEYTLWLGADTVSIMDTEACDILFDYIDYYYYAAATEDEFFADAFAQAGEHMMKVTRSSGYYVVIVLVAGAAVFVVYKTIKSRKEKKDERKKKAEEILNTPLETFGSGGADIDELAKKYEKE